MNRRGFLLGSASLVGAVPAICRAEPPRFRNQVTFVVISDIARDTPIDHLLAVFDALTERGLPFTCSVNPFDQDGRALRPEDTVAAVLKGYIMQGRGIDVAAHLPDLGKLSAYFQGRRIRNANAALIASLTRHWDAPSAQEQFRVVVCDDVDSPNAPTGVRSAGVRTIIVLPEEDAPVTSEAWPDGVVRVFGGTRIDLASYSSARVRPDPEATQAICHVSLANIAEHTPVRTYALASTFAEDLLALERTGRNAVQLAAELQLRDNYDFGRLIALHLTRPTGDDPNLQAGFEAFLSDLTTRGITPSIGEAGGGVDPDREADYWLPVAPTQLSRASEAELTRVSRPDASGMVNALAAPGLALPPGHSAALGEVRNVAPGFDEDGVLWLPCLDITDTAAALKLSETIGHTNDLVISIAPEAMVEPFARIRLLDQLMGLTSDGVTRIVPVQELGRAIAPTGAEIERQRRTIAALPATRPQRRARPATGRDMLLEDARIAWSYIEKGTNRDTGLCPATVDFSGNDLTLHDTVTMWDVGSHINGIVAASQLGLIERPEFERRIDSILAQIGGRTSQDRHLPQGWLQIDRHRWGSSNFDVSDAGRLLASFDNLRRHAGMDDRLHALVDSWDLDQIIIDGEGHSVTDGTLSSVFRSHSAHYTARAFRKWGLGIESPYEVFQGRSLYDDQMALLEAASWIGPMGAEPLLLEALEIDMSPESAYLAEVLFAAQIEDHDETGRLIAVSEGPLDRAPWFTYQGLQFDALERTWALDTVGHEPAYADPQFWEDYLVISSKAAFLWAAYRPHDYSDRLVAYVREKSRTHRGFASSIFSKTGEVTANYSDLNTNGVILQSIARLLTET